MDRTDWKNLGCTRLWALSFISFWLTLVFLAQATLATVTVTTTTNAATLASAIAAGNGGIALTGTPALGNGSSTTVAGTFTTSGSTLGVTSGIVLGTGNTSLVPGSPLPAGNLSTAGSGVSNAGASEFDVATFTFSFIPNPGVVRMSISSVFASEEYNEYVNTTFTDNFSMLLSGGVYTNFNLATIPGTSSGTDINTVNNGANSGYYRDNSTATPVIPDIKMDGATRVFINAFDVVPGTTYTLTIRIADVGDANYDSIAFVSASSIINNPPALDLSVAASGTGYTTTWVQGSGPIAVAATDDKISDDGTTISSATLTLNSPSPTDLLSVGALPAPITASTYDSVTGLLTLTGVATLAEYQAALQAVAYSSTATNPTGPAKTLTVMVNDGVDNSNTATTTINVAALSVTKTAGTPTVALGASNTLTDAGDTITYSYSIKNNGNVTLTLVSPVDAGPSFNGTVGTGSMSAYTPVSASVAAGATQVFTATYTLTAADVSNGAGTANGVTNVATAKGTAPNSVIATSASSSAATTLTAVAAITVTKSASAPSVSSGANPALTDVGDSIVFTYVLRNVGSVALTNVFPTDTGPRFNGLAGTNTLGAFSPASPVALAVGASQTFTATYILSATDISRAVGITNGVSNTATASALNPSGTTISSPVSTANATIVAVPSLRISKSYVLNDLPGGTAGAADLSETIAYSYVVTNDGNVPISNVSINDQHGTPPVGVPLGSGGIGNESLSSPGPLGSGASSDVTGGDGYWSVLAPGASATFDWLHTVSQAEMDHG